MSNKLTVDSMNEAIALFMGGSSIKEHGGNRYVYYPESCAKDVAELKYHESWNHLKPVIDEIFKYALAYLEQVKPVIDMSIVVEIRSAHEKAYRFIQWYNKSNTTNDTTTNHD